MFFTRLFCFFIFLFAFISVSFAQEVAVPAGSPPVAAVPASNPVPPTAPAPSDAKPVAAPVPSEAKVDSVNPPAGLPVPVARLAILVSAEHKLSVLDAKGVLLHAVPASKVLELAPGSYIVQVERAGYETMKIEKKLASGQLDKVETERLPWRKPEGTLVINDPADAVGIKVYIDGLLAGKTPLTLARVPGNYVVRVAEGELDAEESVTLLDKQNLTLNFKLDWKAGKVFRDCATCPELVVIPSGKFLMGSDKADADERPEHTVSIKQRYSIGLYEVSQAEWQDIMGKTDTPLSCADCPVVEIGLDEVKEFLRRLNAKTGHLYRLPSEAEWEYACRGGKSEPYCGGGEPDSLAWFDSNSEGKTHPVGQKKPNAFGLYDMNGNVWEWVDDCWNDSYVLAPDTGKSWLTGNCNIRVLRGGSWFNGKGALRPTLRFRYSSATRANMIGFRVVRAIGHKP